MSRTVELRESVYDRLVEAAQAEGLPPEAWIESKLPALGEPMPSDTVILEEARARLARFAGAFRVGHPHGTDNEPVDADRRAALDRLFSHTVDMGRPLGTDNEGIDADLAREYLDPHEPS